MICAARLPGPAGSNGAPNVAPLSWLEATKNEVPVCPVHAAYASVPVPVMLAAKPPSTVSCMRGAKVAPRSLLLRTKMPPGESKLSQATYTSCPDTAITGRSEYTSVPRSTGAENVAPRSALWRKYTRY